MLFVTFNRDEAKNSEEARKYAYDFLLGDTGFLNPEGSRFNTSIADWFVIGGRWSGHLTEQLLDQEQLRKYWDEFNRQELTNILNTKAEIQREKAHKLFMEYFPDFKGEIPVYRNLYIGNGYPDDAMIVTKELYDKVLKQYEGEPDYEEDGLEFADLECECVDESFIGNKWVVVVDYHS